MITVTATNLPRVMQCNGSLLMPQIEPESVSPSRAEGDAAHWLIQQVHSRKFCTDELVERKAPNGVFITEDMVQHVTPYLTAIAGRGETEVESTFGDKKTWQVTSRADRREVTADTLYIDDFKYGYSIVEPEMNWTLLAHAFGYVWNMSGPYPSKYTFTIYQPRPYHPKGKIRSWTISHEQLIDYYIQVELTLTKPSNLLVTGNNCRNCLSRTSCPAALKAFMNAVDISEQAYVSNVDDKTLSDLMDTFKRAEDVIDQTKKAYTELAKYRIKQGAIVPNYQLENELANRSWKPDTTAEILHSMTGIDVSKKTIVTPAQAEKLGLSADFVNLFTQREIKGTKLTRVDGNTKAAKLFTQPKG